METLKAFCSAILCNSALMDGFTHKVRCTVFRFLGSVCDRDGLVLNWRGRISFFGGAGCGEAARSRWGVGLSCHTSRSDCFTLRVCTGDGICSPCACCGIGASLQPIPILRLGIDCRAVICLVVNKVSNQILCESGKALVRRHSMSL